MRKILTEGLKELGIVPNEDVLSGFEQYYELLSQRNAVMNLTAIKGIEDTARLHFLDCAALCSLYNFDGASLIDVGTGAGFPGLPLKILKRDISATLLDGTQKRVNFLSEVCSALSLENVRCVCGRAEEEAASIGGSFDIAVSRAVARLNILCELCLPFVHVGGVFIAMTGPDCQDELSEASNAIAVLGGGQAEIKKYTIPGTDIVHSAVIIKKLRPTSPLYPRQFGQIKKKPL